MRLGHNTASLTLTLCSALALAACGDDGDPGTGNDGSTGSTGTPGDTTDNPPPATTNADSTGDDSPGDSTTSGDPTTGVDSTGMGEDSGTDEGSGSSGGGMGACAGGMSFETLTSTENDMLTRLVVTSDFVSCDREVTIVVTGGTICATDDGAGGYYYEVVTLNAEDIPEINCDDGISEATLAMEDVSIETIGTGTEVVVPQSGGTTTGVQPITINGRVTGMSLLGPIDEMLEGFDGVLPTADVAFGDSDTTPTYADTETVVATAMPELGIEVTVTLIGLTGSVTFAE